MRERAGSSNLCPLLLSLLVKKRMNNSLFTSSNRGVPYHIRTISFERQLIYKSYNLASENFQGRKVGYQAFIA